MHCKGPRQGAQRKAALWQHGPTPFLRHVSKIDKIACGEKTFPRTLPTGGAPLNGKPVLRLSLQGENPLISVSCILVVARNNSSLQIHFETSRKRKVNYTLATMIINNNRKQRDVQLLLSLLPYELYESSTAAN